MNSSIPSLLDKQYQAKRFGRCTKVTATMVFASGTDFAIGDRAELVGPGTVRRLGQVLALTDNLAVICPFGGVQGMSTQTRIYRVDNQGDIPVGPEMIGRVLDFSGQPIDGLPMFEAQKFVNAHADPPSPMTRPPISEFLPTGIKAIDGLLPMAKGQRMGIFAPAGGGKSTLLGMLTRGCVAEIVVIALIGERGREVREFVDVTLGQQGMSRSIVFCATADCDAIERLHCAYSATAVAEFFRDQGYSVLLLVDSITRYARAQREIGLALGEPPTRRGYPPSLFAMLPKLFERAGNSRNGSITAIYTVLIEDEDSSDPLAEEVKSLLDGHIILSRQLGESGHFPAIAIDESLSRLASGLMDGNHAHCARKFRQMKSIQNELEILIRMGEYKRGVDPNSDHAIDAKVSMNAFLQQTTTEHVQWSTVLLQLESCIEEDTSHQHEFTN
jgi:ATP synthase in type III secretion protein N